MKKVIAVFLCIALFFSAIGVLSPITAFAGESNNFSCTFETDAEIQPNKGYYCGTSNANGYKLDDAGYKYDNYSGCLLSKAGPTIQNGHHMAIPVVQSGIGHNNSNGAMRLMYDDNIPDTGDQVNPGFTLMDSADKKSHKPKQGEGYKITIFYKAEKITQPVTLYVGQKKGALSDRAFSKTLDIVEAPALNVVEITTISAATSDYVKASAVYTGYGSKNLVVYMVSSMKTDQKGTSVLIDDITVEKVSKSTVTFDSKGGTPVTELSGLIGEKINYTEVPLKENCIFDGWYTDESLSVKAPTVFPDKDTLLYAKWKEADTTLSIDEDFEKYNVGNNCEGIFGNDAAREISSDRSHNKNGTKSLKMTCRGYKNVAATPQFVLTNKNGNPAHFKKGKVYSASVYIWVDETRQYNVRFSSVSSLGAAPDCKRRLEYEKKYDLTAGEWNKVTCSFMINGLDKFDYNYLTLGISLTNGDETKTYVFYVDSVKIQESDNGSISYIQDYEEFEAKNYSGNESVSIRGNGSGRTVSDKQNHTTDGKNALCLNMNRSNKTNVARTVVQFDDEDFYTNQSMGYEISFWAYTSSPIKAKFVLGTTKNSSNLWESSSWEECCEYVELEANTWTLIKMRKANFSAPGYLTLGASYPDAETNPLPMYIDDIKVEQFGNLGKIVFDSNGGEAISPIAVFPNTRLGVLPDCVWEGHIFEGWYDKESNKLYTSNSFSPASGNLELYAMWSTFDGKASSISTGFELSEYEATPYANTGADLSTDQINMSAGATWLSDAQEYANNGSGVMKLVNDPFVTEDNNSYQAVALMNPDGTRFRVVKGQKYRISYSFLNSTPGSAHSYVSAVISSSGINRGVGVRDQVLTRNVIHGIGDDWNVSNEYFTAYNDGFVYMTLCARRSTSSSSSRYHTVYIDDVTVEVLDDTYTKVTFMSDDKLVGTRIGKAGTTIQPPAVSYKSGFEFSGWYTDQTCTEKYTSFVFADKDATLYAGYIKAEPEEYSSTPFEKISFSFEEKAFVNEFYNSEAHRSYDGDNPLIPELELINDSKFAHNGNYSMKMNAIDWHYVPIRFSLYNTSNKYGILVLQPGEEYKVSYYVMLDTDVSETGTMMLYLSNVEDIKSESSLIDKAVVEYDDSDESNANNKWVLVEHYVTNDSKTPKALAIGNEGFNSLITCYIDDITVSRLKDVNIVFDSMGGDAVEGVQVRTGYYLEEPYSPYRDGYVFDGWYSDKECKNLFNFSKTAIEDNLTLYAGWKKEEIEENQLDEQNDAAQENTDEINDAAKNSAINTNKKEKQVDVGKPPVLFEKDPIKLAEGGQKKTQNGKIDVKKLSSSVPLWKIIVPIVCGTVVLAGTAILLFILIKRRKSDKNRR